MSTDATYTYIVQVSARLTEVLHESRYNQCSNSSDTCATREPAAELAEILLLGPSEQEAWDDWHKRWYRPSQPLPRTVARRGWRRRWHL